MADADWYCAEVLAGAVPGLDVLHDSAGVLAFRPPRRGFGVDHVIVIPKRHVPSLLELDPSKASALLAVLQAVAAELVEVHGGCQVLTNLGTEQHNKHLHFHVAVGDGIARFVDQEVRPDP